MGEEPRKKNIDHSWLEKRRNFLLMILAIFVLVFGAAFIIARNDYKRAVEHIDPRIVGIFLSEKINKP